MKTTRTYNAVCPSCMGTGRIKNFEGSSMYIICPACNGSKTVTTQRRMNKAEFIEKWKPEVEHISSFRTNFESDFNELLSLREKETAIKFYKHRANLEDHIKIDRILNKSYDDWYTKHKER